MLIHLAKKTIIQWIVLRYLRLFKGNTFFLLYRLCFNWLNFPFYHGLFLSSYISYICSYKDRSCYWNITWLDIYLAILFSLSSCYLIILSDQNQSSYLFLFDIAIKFMIKKTKLFLCGDLRVLYNVMLRNISFPGWRFPIFYDM